MVGDHAVAAIIAQWKLVYEQAIRERDDARVVADRLLRSLMAAARGDQPPPDGIDCDEVRTIATLRRERDDQRDAIHEALGMVAAMRHERDEARAQLAKWRLVWSRDLPEQAGWYLVRAAGWLTGHQEDWEFLYVWEDGNERLHIHSDTLLDDAFAPGSMKWAGPLPEPEETP